VSKKITVEAERRQVSKNAALAMIRRRGYEWDVEGVSIKALPIREFLTSMPTKKQLPPSWSRNGYEHHIEPRLERLGIADSDWMAYINGCTLN
jgi:hypothetical protein